MREKRPSEILAGALDLLLVKNKNGRVVGNNWVQDTAHKSDKDGDYFCVLGAISGAVEGIDQANDSYDDWSVNARKAADLIVESIPKKVIKRFGYDFTIGANIPEWNDDDDTTFSQVKRAMCKALNKALEIENPAPKRKVKKATKPKKRRS